MPYQNIRYTNKLGHPTELVVQIIKKRSKDIIVRLPEDDREFSIPRKAVESISEAVKPINGN